MEKIDQFFKRFNGSYFAFVGAGISLISLFIAIVLYRMVDPTFSPTADWVSDLGEGPNYSNYIFNISEIATGIILIFFYLYLTILLQKKGASKFSIWTTFIIGLFSALGLIVAGIFPMYAAPDIHFNAAAVCFIGIFFLCILYGITELLVTENLKKFSISGFIVATITLIFMISFLLSELNYGINRAVYLLLEWISYLAFMAWIIVQGIYTLKVK